MRYLAQQGFERRRRSDFLLIHGVSNKFQFIFLLRFRKKFDKNQIFTKYVRIHLKLLINGYNYSIMHN